MINITFNRFPKCQCGTDLVPLFDHQKETNETYIKGWYCTKCNKFYLFVVGEVRWKTGKEWVDKQTESREF